ncbi:MAG: serine protease [Actinomycetota bacterium]|nr:serine protease [Actinomycetota bacterium]
MSTSKRRLIVAAAGLVLAALAVALSGPAGAIVGGTPAERGSHPWLVAVTYYGDPLCGGSVIDDDLILTAAHCVASMPTGALVVRAGSTRFGDPAAQVRAVADVRIHEGYRDHLVAYDLAILRLTRPLERNGDTRPIAMADADAQAELIDAGSPAVVAGWGVTSDDDIELPSELLETDQYILGDAQCRIRYAAELARHDVVLVDEAIVCADHPDGHDSCYGDSGGPLVVHDRDDDIWYQLGVVSFGVDEHCGKATVYMEVTGHEDFIASGGTVDRDPTPQPPLP